MAGDPANMDGVPPAETFAKKLFRELDKDHDGKKYMQIFPRH